MKSSEKSVTTRSSEAVVVVVANSESHGGDFAPILVQRESGDIAEVLEGSVALVQVEVVGIGVVGDQQVGLAVVVHVHEDGGEAVVGGRVRNAGFDAHIGKCSVAVVVEQVVGLAFSPRGPHMTGTPWSWQKANADAAVVSGGLVFQIVVDIAGDEQVEPAVAIVVAPGGASRTSCPE